MSEHDDEDAAKLAQAFTKARAMDQLRSYLERGRQYELLSEEELQSRWADAGEAFIGRDDQSRVREFQDLDAEYRAREVASPSHLLKSSIDAAVARIRGYSIEDLEHVQQRLEKFVDDLEKPKN